MLLKEEWASTSGYLESAINAILVAGDDLMSSRALQVIFSKTWKDKWSQVSDKTIQVNFHELY